MDKITYKPLNMEIIRNKKHVFITAEKALEDVIPIEWDEEVINGNKRVLLVEKK